jgi:hypothetical protein
LFKSQVTKMCGICSKRAHKLKMGLISVLSILKTLISVSSTLASCILQILLCNSSLPKNKSQSLHLEVGHTKSWIWFDMFWPTNWSLNRERLNPNQIADNVIFALSYLLIQSTNGHEPQINFVEHQVGFDFAFWPMSKFGPYVAQTRPPSWADSRTPRVRRNACMTATHSC